ncbi:hypothetical protein EVAR_80330_1 [Eumeta japonica]|uniref:Uncharacterized protein n=1 Tax=Eumeta variegata TaxID=151549 RepID=A0A4C1X2I6_EUMVA|nr:hypothetical protein EVAR_80330_1 [Eumeta japonica]
MTIRPQLNANLPQKRKTDYKYELVIPKEAMITKLRYISALIFTSSFISMSPVIRTVEQKQVIQTPELDSSERAYPRRRAMFRKVPTITQRFRIC